MKSNRHFFACKIDCINLISAQEESRMFRLPIQSYPVGLDIGYDLTVENELHLGALFVNDDVILAGLERYAFERGGRIKPDISCLVFGPGRCSQRRQRKKSDRTTQTYTHRATSI